MSNEAGFSAGFSGSLPAPLYGVLVHQAVWERKTRIKPRAASAIGAA